MKKEKLVIIGAGPAGLTAGIYAGRAELSPLIIEGPQPGGQLMGTTYVENWPGEKKILGVDLMMNIKEHAKNTGSKFLSKKITNVDFSKRPFKLFTEDKEEIQSDAIILATGSTPKRLNVPGEDEYWGKGVTTCAVCDGALYKNKKVIIVGGGDTAMEDASFMTKFTDDITIIQILDHLTASKPMQKRVLDNPKIKIIYNSSVTKIEGENDRVSKIEIKNTKTEETKEFNVDGIFIAIGLIPNTKFLENQIELNQWGYVKLNSEVKTSVEGVFAAGDVADYRYRQAITSAGTGCMAALEAERFLSQ